MWRCQRPWSTKMNRVKGGESQRAEEMEDYYIPQCVCDERSDRVCNGREGEGWRGL